MISLPVPVTQRDHVIGLPNAPVTVVQYGDYESPECGQMHKAIEKTIRPLLHQIRLVYRHFPLIKVHPHALRAAEAAEAAAAQDKFWDMHTELYLHPADLKDNDLHRYARRVGLDLKKFDHEMSHGVYASGILRERDLSILSGISGAPTFFVNDRLWAMTGVDLLDAVKALAERSAGAALSKSVSEV
jgi:formate-nitrite transporter family protein